MKKLERQEHVLDRSLFASEACLAPSLVHLAKANESTDPLFLLLLLSLLLPELNILFGERGEGRTESYN